MERLTTTLARSTVPLTASECCIQADGSMGRTGSSVETEQNSKKRIVRHLRVYMYNTAILKGQYITSTIKCHDISKLR